MSVSVCERMISSHWPSACVVCVCVLQGPQSPPGSDYSRSVRSLVERLWNEHSEIVRNANKERVRERGGLTQERGGLIERRDTFSITTKLKTKHGKRGNGGSRAATNALIQPHNGQWKLLSLSFWMCSMSKNFTPSCCNPVKTESNET